MLRIHFTDSDLARVHIAAAPDPLWETVLATQKLAPDGVPVFAHWRRRVRLDVHERGARGALRLLLTLAPPARYFPDFLTPAESADGLTAGLDGLLGTPAARLTHEIGLLGRHRGLPRWAHGVAAGDTDVLGRVADALRVAHDTLVAPQWTTMRTQIDSDRALRARRAAVGGAFGLLESLRPAFHWDSPWLLSTAVSAVPVPQAPESRKTAGDES